MIKELEYLLDTYYNKEDWHEERLSPESAEVFYRRQLRKKNIVFLNSSNKEEPCGYLEIRWLDQEQLSRIINKQEFHAFDENLVDGDFVLVIAAYIEPNYRNKGNLMKLNQMIKEQHKDRDYVGVVYEDCKTGKFSFFRKGEI